MGLGGVVKIGAFFGGWVRRAWVIGVMMVGGGEVWGLEGVQKYSFEKAEMGLPFRVSVYAADEVVAKEGAEAAFRRIEEVNAVMSDYDSDSELSRLSASAGSGKAVEVSEMLWKVLVHAEGMAERTGGAFDVTVGPMVHLWRRARRKVELPEAGVLAAARERVGYGKMRMDAETRTVELRVAGMGLDLGAIAKGYACDEALKVLRQMGLGCALVGGGGDMAVGDAPPGQAGWRVEVGTLEVGGVGKAEVLALKNCGVATSGDLFQRVEIGGKRYSHIVDPRTGLGLTDHGLVTVVAVDGMSADALSTGVSVLGPEGGVKFVEGIAGAAVRVERQPGAVVEVMESVGWKGIPRVGLRP